MQKMAKHSNNQDNGLNSDGDNYVKQYEEATSVSNDERDFLSITMAISKWEREVSVLSGEFMDLEIDAYHAKLRLKALIDVMTSMGNALEKTL